MPQNFKVNTGQIVIKFQRMVIKIKFRTRLEGIKMLCKVKKMIKLQEMVMCGSKVNSP